MYVLLIFFEDSRAILYSLSGNIIRDFCITIINNSAALEACRVASTMRVCAATNRKQVVSILLDYASHFECKIKCNFGGCIVKAFYLQLF